MTDRAPNTVWTLRKFGATPNASVRTMPEDHIGIGHWGDLRLGPQTLTLSRKDARLLAKRINQCLDATVKR